MARAEEKKKDDIRVYMISCLFFICITAGGALLSMYVTLPETEPTTWYPIAGLTLVAIPWVFWILIFLYTCVKAAIILRNPSQGANRGKGTSATAAAAKTTFESSSVDSTGGGGGDQGHAHVGAAIAIGEEDSPGDGENEAAQTHQAPTHDEEVGSHGTSESKANDREGSAARSNDSESPFALSMSS
ncbi:PREDICTED: uncharacterized protein LOC104611610 [Nelumbo nucifera]|uniref:Uncharacterized protein n=2 Tax=Nelumbo nucifera TaxID=4432 RepID=A0A822XXZ1_NELNU|nr:PREDICTED: uncharacterized protein LOC104611610 [Nelumbo nucifera]DAD24882.1 TPA_asm: hypothetical protein HUJ06_026346 [Nelumbo nucifera]